MTTDKQALANRRNARKSTGPITVFGKAVSAQNSLKHGVLAQAQVLVSRGEDVETFEELQESLHEDLQPEGELERVLADRVVALVWRLRRLHLAEVGLYNEAAENYESRDRTLDYALGLPEPTSLPAAAAGSAFINGTTESALTSLSRYERTIETGLFKTLDELRHIQNLRSLRRGAGRPLPVSVDALVGDLV